MLQVPDAGIFESFLIIHIPISSHNTAHWLTKFDFAGIYTWSVIRVNTHYLFLPHSGALGFKLIENNWGKNEEAVDECCTFKFYILRLTSWAALLFCRYLCTHREMTLKWYTRPGEKEEWLWVGDGNDRLRDGHIGRLMDFIEL